MDNKNFICFEGIDGAGKTSIAGLFSQYLEYTGEKVFFLDKKNINAIDNIFVRNQLKHIKSALWDYPIDADISLMGDYHWMTLLASWYSALYDGCIKQKINLGYKVVCDGWVYKYIARFSLKENFPDEFVKNIFNFIPQPDYIFFLHVSPEIALSRKSEIKPSESGQYDGEGIDKLAGFINYQNNVQERLKEIIGQRMITINNNKTNSMNSVVNIAFDYIKSSNILSFSS